MFTRRFVAALKARSTDLAKQMASGACASYSDYREMTGRVKGLDDALVIFEDLYKDQQQEEDK
jgi:hypothetical protein